MLPAPHAGISAGGTRGRRRAQTGAISWQQYAITLAAPLLQLRTARELPTTVAPASRGRSTPSCCQALLLQRQSWIDGLNFAIFFMGRLSLASARSSQLANPRLSKLAIRQGHLLAILLCAAWTQKALKYKHEQWARHLGPGGICWRNPSGDGAMRRGVRRRDMSWFGDRMLSPVCTGQGKLMKVTP